MVDVVLEHRAQLGPDGFRCPGDPDGGAVVSGPAAESTFQCALSVWLHPGPSVRVAGNDTAATSATDGIPSSVVVDERVVGHIAVTVVRHVGTSRKLNR